MGVTLTFHGGLFTASPAAGPIEKLDVHFRLLERLQVFDRSGNHLVDLETHMSSATRLDFEGGQSLETIELPIRRISHLIPIDYQGFKKSVGLSGGKIKVAGPRVPRARGQSLGRVKERGQRDEMLSEFRAFTGVHAHQSDDPYLFRLVTEFFKDLSLPALRRWLPGLSTNVTLAAGQPRVVVNGQMDGALSLPSGARIVFRPHPQSTIPHYPLGNPHVLEQPPTV